MREIEFRGKDIETGKWVYGSYFEHKKVNLCIASESEIIENTQHLIVRDKIACDWNFRNGIEVVDVDPKTVGQYTGLKDKNGTKIYEGDVVKVLGMIGKVISQCGSFGICFNDCVDYEKLDKFTQKRVGNNFSGVCCDNFISIYEIWWNLNNLDDYLYEVEIIGNIYDNPKLLEDL